MPSPKQSFYQTPSTPRLYVSYPLWQYSNGALNHVYPQERYDEGLTHSPYNNITREDMFDMIKFYDNSKIHTISTDHNSGTNEVFLGWQCVDRPTYTLEDDGSVNHTGPIGYTEPSTPLWDFNYAMILNHNFATCPERYEFHQIRGVKNESELMEQTDLIDAFDRNIVNAPANARFDYNGFSVFELGSMADKYSLGMGLRIFSASGQFWESDVDAKFSSILWGRYYDFPFTTSCSINTRLSYQYDKKTTKNIYGETISASKWNRTDSWLGESYGIGDMGTEPFGLKDSLYNNVQDINAGQKHNLFDHAQTHRRKTGLRVWDINFDSIPATNIMPQNPMLNQNGHWVGPNGVDSAENWDNGQYTAGDNKSMYNIDYARDFYTNIVHRTNGGELPMIMQLNRTDPSPHNFVLVRMTDYKIRRTTENLHSVTLRLEEQI